jgi:hypothetical protein
MVKRREIGAAVGLLLAAAGLTWVCAPQSDLSSAASISARTASAAVQERHNSFLYADATSVQLLYWTETEGGTLRGETDELQNLNPGSPTFITSNLAWSGTRRGEHIMVTLPGVTILATLDGATLMRQVPDPHTGQMVTERWVAGTLGDYNTLVEAFREYVALGQDLQAISFQLQTAQQFPSPYTPARVQSYLDDAHNQLAALQALPLPHLPGLALPWVIPSQQISATVAAAGRFLGTPEPVTG